MAKLCPKFNYIGPNKNLGWSHIFFKVRKIIKFLNFIYNNDFFSRPGWSCGHLNFNMEPPGYVCLEVK